MLPFFWVGSVFDCKAVLLRTLSKQKKNEAEKEKERENDEEFEITFSALNRISSPGSLMDGIQTKEEKKSENHARSTHCIPN